ncbi:acyltransferase family protein [Aeoliella mucimassa]|uniref:O-acetyltransferase OatA n=1 Tax=Aeoliella mucimassa TaxID=2527972 RepID=A0A518AH37_9BACT|nr:acyltransferase [Aeoliella mucimassa]QDU54038.1 O-acetyltransferase OatA [Aeoliella mucimassa]
MTNSYHFQHIAALDGLRGTAVLVVLLAHMSPLYASGAFGVDVFFVLSGFLITSILIRELIGTQRIAIGRFYARRFLRLLPALWITTTGLVALKWISGELTSHFLWEAVWAVTYTMNWVDGLSFGESRYLVHTWSLAIEEQFYLLWPIALLGLRRTGISLAKQTALLFTLGIFVGVYRNLCEYDSLRIYHGLDTHCDGLLFGSALALLAVGGLERFATANRAIRWLAPVAVMAILVLPVYFTPRSPFTIRWGYSLVAVLSTIVVWHCVTYARTRLVTLFQLRLLVFTGKISYGLYLYHWPIWNFLKSRLPTDHSWLKFATCTLLAYVLASISFYLIERPILRLKDRYFGSIATT